MRADTNVWGDPNQPTVVSLHGAGGTRWFWTPHAELLADEYHVVSLDLPGHGTHPNASFNLERAVVDIGVALDTYGPAVLVGHSLGAQVAMEAAAAHEARVNGLFVAGTEPDLNPFLGWLGLPMAYLIEAAAKIGWLKNWLDDLYGLEDERQLPPESTDTHDPAVATARAIRESLFHNATSAAAQFSGPTAVAHSRAKENDADAEAFAERTDAHRYWYNGGHGYPIRNPAEFVELVDAFLTDIQH